MVAFFSSCMGGSETRKATSVLSLATSAADIHTIVNPRLAGTMNITVPDCSLGQLLCGDDVSSYFCLDIDDFKCSYQESCGCPPLRADPDIAGYGVRLLYELWSQF